MDIGTLNRKLSSAIDSSDYELTIKLFTENILIAKESVNAINNCMFAYMNIGRFQEIIQLFKENELVARINAHVIARCMFAYNEIDQFKEGIQLFKENELVAKTDARAIRMCIILYNNTKQYQEAIKLFKENELLAKTDVNSIYQCMCIYNETGQPEQAIKLFKENELLAKMDLDSIYQCMCAYNNTDQFKKAIKLFKENESVAKTNAFAIYLCMYAYNKVNKLKKTIKLFKENESVAKTNALAIYQCMCAYNETGQPEEAIKLFEENESVAKTDVFAIHQCMCAYNETGQPEQTIKLFKENESVAKTDTFAIYLCMCAYHKVNKLKKAIKLFEENESVAKTDAFAIHQCMCAYNETGQPEEAIKLFEENESVARTNALAIGQCMFAYNETSQPEEAIKLFEENESVAKTDAFAIHQCMYAHNEVYELAGAIMLFEENESVAKTDAFAIGQCMRAYNELDHFEEAIKLFKENESAAKTDAGVIVYCIIAYLNTNQPEEAIKLFEDNDLKAHAHMDAIGWCIDVYNTRGQYQEAIKLFKENESVAKIDADAIKGCIIGYLNTNQPEEAIKLFEDNKLKTHVHMDAIAWCINVYNTRDQYQEAIKLFKENESVAKTDAFAIGQCMRAYNELDHFEEAIKLFKENESVAKTDAFAIGQCIDVYNTRGQYQKVIKLFKENELILKRDDRAIDLCISAYNKLGQRAEGIRLYNKNKLEANVDISTINRCMFGYNQTGQYEETIWLFDRYEDILKDDDNSIDQYVLAKNCIEEQIELKKQLIELYSNNDYNQISLLLIENLDLFNVNGHLKLFNHFYDELKLKEAFIPYIQAYKKLDNFNEIDRIRYRTIRLAEHEINKKDISIIYEEIANKIIQTKRSFCKENSDDIYQCIYAYKILNQNLELISLFQENINTSITNNKSIDLYINALQDTKSINFESIEELLEALYLDRNYIYIVKVKESLEHLFANKEINLNILRIIAESYYYINKYSEAKTIYELMPNEVLIKESIYISNLQDYNQDVFNDNTDIKANNSKKCIDLRNQYIESGISIDEAIILSYRQILDINDLSLVDKLRYANALYRSNELDLAHIVYKSIYDALSKKESLDYIVDVLNRSDSTNISTIDIAIQYANTMESIGVLRNDYSDLYNYLLSKDRLKDLSIYEDQVNLNNNNQEEEQIMNHENNYINRENEMSGNTGNNTNEVPEIEESSASTSILEEDRSIYRNFDIIDPNSNANRLIRRIEEMHPNNESISSSQDTLEYLFAIEDAVEEVENVINDNNRRGTELSKLSPVQEITTNKVKEVLRNIPVNSSSNLTERLLDNVVMCLFNNNDIDTEDLTDKWRKHIVQTSKDEEINNLFDGINEKFLQVSTSVKNEFNSMSSSLLNHAAESVVFAIESASDLNNIDTLMNHSLEAYEQKIYNLDLTSLYNSRDIAKYCFVIMYVRNQYEVFKTFNDIDQKVYENILMDITKFSTQDSKAVLHYLVRHLPDRDHKVKILITTTIDFDKLKLECRKASFNKKWNAFVNSTRDIITYLQVDTNSKHFNEFYLGLLKNLSRLSSNVNNINELISLVKLITKKLELSNPRLRQNYTPLLDRLFTDHVYKEIMSAVLFSYLEHIKIKELWSIKNKGYIEGRKSGFKQYGVSLIRSIRQAGVVAVGDEYYIDYYKLLENISSKLLLKHYENFNSLKNGNRGTQITYIEDFVALLKLIHIHIFHQPFSKDGLGGDHKIIKDDKTFDTLYGEAYIELQRYEVELNRIIFTKQDKESNYKDRLNNLEKCIAKYQESMFGQITYRNSGYVTCAKYLEAIESLQNKTNPSSLRKAFFKFTNPMSLSKGNSSSSSVSGSSTNSRTLTTNTSRLGTPLTRN